MVDAGTLNIIEDLLLRTSRNRQLMLFSATIPDHIKELANKYVTKGKFIDMKALTGTIAPKQLLHRVVLVSEKEMKLVISDLLRLKCPQRCIIFVKTKFEGYKLSSELLSFGHQSLILNADIPQNERERCLFLFRKGHLPLLIVTDLAARGVDIPACDMVIQTPSAVSSIENYIHRAGRAGRSGRNGINYQLLYANCEPHAKFFNDISKIALVARESKPVLKDIITESLFRAEKEMEKVDESSYTPAIALAKKILKGSSSRGEVEIAQLLSLCAKLNLLLK
ncbi:DEAD-box ATP-dependent RNA helicase CshE-like [Zophobas morio]|uniref:DEAD-box ATP-dependent RNA helicase CshE-like n=1 Tax=Zophobas morio TaxID=2755281 RepID=UPI0030836733